MIEKKKYRKITANDIINNNFSIEDLNIKRYIPFMEKRKIIDAIIDTLLLEDDGMVQFDELDRFVTFIMVSIDSYIQNIDFEDKYIECYDALAENDKISEIISAIGNDITELKDFFEIECNNRLKQNNIEYILNRKLTEMNGIFNGQVQEVVKQLTEIGTEVSSNITGKEVVNFISSYLKK